MTLLTPIWFLVLAGAILKCYMRVDVYIGLVPEIVAWPNTFKTMGYVVLAHGVDAQPITRYG